MTKDIIVQNSTKSENIFSANGKAQKVKGSAQVELIERSSVCPEGPTPDQLAVLATLIDPDEPRDLNFDYKLKDEKTAQQEIIFLLINSDDFVQKTINYLDSSIFVDKAHCLTCKIIQQCFKKTGHKPTYQAIITEINDHIKDDTLTYYLGELDACYFGFEMSLINPKWTLDRITEWSKLWLNNWLTRLNSDLGVRQFENFGLKDPPEITKLKETIKFVEAKIAGTSKQYQFNAISDSEFVDTDYPREWLIQRLLVKGQSCIIGGPQKVLKTSIAVDLVVSLTTGEPFLGKFKVYKPLKVCILSGESGEPTLKEIRSRVCKAKGINGKITNLSWAFNLPKLSKIEDLVELVKGLKNNGVEVVVIDPVYLCLLAGGDGTKNAANVFDMGELILTVVNALKDIKVTTIFIHHTRKNLAAPYEPLELTDLAFAGFGEAIRQWLLINRRSKFDPSNAKNELWVTCGGSDGQSGLWGLDIIENRIDDNFEGRTWDVKISSRDSIKEDKEIAKKSKITAEQYADEQHFLQCLRDWEGELPTKTKFNNYLGWNENKFERILTHLEQNKKIDLIKVKRQQNNGLRKVEVLTLIEDEKLQPTLRNYT